MNQIKKSILRGRRIFSFRPVDNPAKSEYTVFILLFPEETPEEGKERACSF
jgi:hypothetical protein